ncbi:hypothetical protein GCM10028825_24080 [Spirosoma agri]|uniref:Uncharacterized protein n=1 Tax=Spirosoma agri TaxID=1987381 RepID=A0A6M0IE93_9BACT|nr:hypothetical protein [Spirosoma agri]
MHQAVDQMQSYFDNQLALKELPIFVKEVPVSREKVSDFNIWTGS